MMVLVEEGFMVVMVVKMMVGRCYGVSGCDVEEVQVEGSVRADG